MMMNASWSHAMMVVGLSTVIASAQLATSRPVRLIVMDQSGATIPGAKVAVLAADGQLLAVREASSVGQVMLDFGLLRYSLRVEMPGFVTRKFQVDATGTTQPVVVVLKVGSCTNCVEVREDPAITRALSPWSPPLDTFWIVAAAVPEPMTLRSISRVR
jgi:hypothetical protein